MKTTNDVLKEMNVGRTCRNEDIAQYFEEVSLPFLLFNCENLMIRFGAN